MSLPLVVVVLVAGGDAREVSTQALTATAQEALEPGAIVLLREVASPTLLSDEEAARIGSALHADAVALVTWPDEDHGHARVHLFAAKQSAWIDREIAFAGSDAPAERGRALGFNVASMVPRVPDLLQKPVAARVDVVSPPPSVAARRDPTASIDLAASGALGGAAAGYGGDVAVRVRVARSLWARVGGTVRVGEIEAAQVSASVVRLSAGVAWHPFAKNNTSPVDGALRTDIAVFHYALSRPADEGSTVRGARWLSGMVAMAEGTWRFLPPISLLAAIGPEVAFGDTRVVVNDETIATLPAVRVVGELGMRASF